MRFLVFVVMMMFLAGCDQASLMKKMIPPEADSTARGYIDLLRQNRFKEIEKDLDPSINTPDIPKALVKMAQMFPAEKPESVTVVGVHTFHNDVTTTTNMTYEYQFRGTWLLVNVATKKQGAATTIVGFNLNPIPDSLENLNRFTLSGKSPLQYSVLALAVLFTLFTLYSLVICVRTKPLKKKWLWILLILLGAAKFSVDWTTGRWDVFPLYVQLFSASAYAPLYGAWTISISLPLGAVVFLLMRKSLSGQPTGTPPLAGTASENEEWRI